MFTMPITTNKPVNFISFSIVLLVIMGLCFCIAPDTAYASSVDPLGYGSAHFPFEPSVSDLSGYFVIEDSHGDDVMFSYNFMPVVSVEVAGVTTPPAVQLYISGSRLTVSPTFDSSSIGDFALYMFEDDSVSLVAYTSHIGQSPWEYVYEAPYSITGLALVGSSVTLPIGNSREYDAISLSFGSDDPYPELLYLYYQEIQGDLYDSFYPVVTAWLESIGGNTSNMQSYLQQLTIQLTNYFGKTTFANGDLTLLGYAESIDSSLQELIAAASSSDELLQSLLDFLSGTGSSTNSLMYRIAGGLQAYYSSAAGQQLSARYVSSGIIASGIDDTLLSIDETLSSLSDVLSDLNAERELWEPASEFYRYSEVNDKSKGFFQSLWQAIFGPVFSLNPSSSFEYTYIDEYGDPQTGHISFVRLVQELIFSDYDDGSLDYNYFDYFDAGYLP